MSNKTKLQDNNERLLDMAERMLDVAESIGKLKTIDEVYTATEGQTEFPIAFETFDYLRDTVFVTSGRTTLTAGLDYTVESQKVVLMEGVPEGRTIAIRIQKNTNTDAKDSTMSGAYITKGSIPLDRLAEEIPQPTAESLGAVKETELPTKIKSLLTGGEISMVKKVQRGFVKGGKITAKEENVGIIDATTNHYGIYLDISIEAVNPSKTQVSMAMQGTDSDADFPIWRFLNNNTLRVYVGGSSGNNVTVSHRAFVWEVTEFY